MKKLVIAFAMVLGFASIANAQTGVAKATTGTKPVAVKPATAVAAKPALSTATAKPAVVKPATAPKAAAATKLKADGTPDMRFKANKTAAAPVAGPKKADGTADMRFKANKAAAAKKP